MTSIADEVKWQDRGACAKHPWQMWFPEYSNQTAEAIDICVNECPVRKECARYAVACGESNAIAAGFRCNSVREREAMKRWVGGDCTADVRPRRHYVRKRAKTTMPNPGFCAGCKAVTISRGAPIEPGQRRYHGGGYCDTCYRKMRRKEIRDSLGDAAPRVPAGPARKHLLALQAAGMRRSEIVAATGLSYGTLYGIAHPPGGKLRERITPRTAQKILSVPVPRRVRR
ncbi:MULTISPECIES: WhiB family transcriptional regulator [Nocardia]|uniref:WhiB family transcriptional regulator n=1 Tax=Nocardia TaxID=1817 RepID=UPI0024540402|nr:MULTISPECIES: WhiB family transcriptional regulator [Nocardia]